MTTETTPSAILYQEHATISAALGYLDLAVDALERGQRVEPRIFHDLDEFFTLFVGRCHCGKEEQLLFPALPCTPDIAALVMRLKHDHVLGGVLADAYAAAVDGYVQHGLAGAARLILVARLYTAALRRHIAGENETLLPCAEQTESPAEQAELTAAFARYNASMMGKGRHEQLQRMIETLDARLAAAGS